MKKALWIGPLAHPTEVINSKAISAAANLWQLSFINGLVNNNVDVSVFTYVPQQIWPLGPFWALKGKKSINKKGVTEFNISYLNIIFIRDIWIILSILKISLKKLSYFKNKTIFTYNPLPKHRFSAKILKIILKTKWISVLADDLVKGKADLTLFLSHDYYNRYGEGEKYFLDGGVPQNKKTNSHDTINGNKIILYAGSQSNITGIDEFINIFSKFKDKSYELHIYGKGHNENIKKASLKDNRIKQYGFVSDDVLDKACRRAYAFVNPRISSSEANNTFPSKLLLYLQYKKPIISTKVLGISPKYEKIIHKYDNSNFNSLIECLSKIEQLDRNSSNLILQKFNEENSWDNLVGNFVKHISRAEKQILEL